VLNSEIKRLNWRGWLLAVAAFTGTVLVSIPVGRWALESIERSTFRSYRTLLVFLMSIPGFIAAVVVFSVGRHLLDRLGIRVHRIVGGGAPNSPQERMRPAPRAPQRLNRYAHPQPLSDFEAAVLFWIAARSGDLALQEQLARARVAERDYTVVGCYSKLVVPIDAPASTATYADRGPLNGPYFESEAVEHGGGTLLWFEAGRAVCMEIYAHGDYFPADHSELGEFRLSGDT
jgi:hypothetical protein